MRALSHAIALVLLIAACGAGGDAAQSIPSEERRVVNSLTDVRSAVVRIEVEGVLEYPSGPSDEYATGSGFLISEDGYIVTNNHVVAGSSSIKVYLDGHADPLDGAVVGTSECADLAVLDVDVADQPYLAWADSEPSVGQQIFVAGFPLGDPEFTLIDGIISKQHADGETTWASVDSVVEHTGDTLPGSSGGPIVDPSGAVLGVNYAGDDYGQAFGISVAIARVVVDDILEGKPTQSIGINGWAHRNGHGAGVWVAGVETGTPADRAGILAGDLITHLDGLIVGSDGTLSTYCRILKRAQHDAPIDVQVWRESRDRAYAGALYSDRRMAATGPSSTGSSSPPHQNPGLTPSGDRILIEFLRDWSSDQPYLTVFDVMDDDSILKGAYLICDAFSSGASVDHIFRTLLDNITNEQDQLDMAGFVGISVATLCPEYSYLFE